MSELRDYFGDYGVWLFVVAQLLVFSYIAGLFARRPLKFKRAAILTKNEMEFYSRLRSALPDLFVFPQMSMAGVIRPNESGKRYGRAFAKICSKRIDFTVCRQDLSVVCVIELDDRTHDKSRDVERDAMMSSAGIPTIRYESRAKPSVEKIGSDVEKLAQ